MWIRERTATTDPLPDNLAAARREASLRGWVRALAKPRHFWAERAMNRRVGMQLAEAFGRLGFRVELQGNYRNVVALPADLEGACTLVGAHYDSVPGSPGADDNASGLAAMLECAGHVAAAGIRDVGFVAFNAEEDGLLGSQSFVREGLDAFGLRLRLVHVLEMCGFRDATPGSQRAPLPPGLLGFDAGTFIALVGRGASNAEVRTALGPRAAPHLHRVGVETTALVGRLLPDLGRSDHAPFWNADLPALLWTDTGNFRNPHYHRSTDTADTLDYRFLRAVTDLLCATVTRGASP